MTTNLATPLQTSVAKMDDALNKAAAEYKIDWKKHIWPKLMGKLPSGKDFTAIRKTSYDQLTEDRPRPQRDAR